MYMLKNVLKGITICNQQIIKFIVSPAAIKASDVDDDDGDGTITFVTDSQTASNGDTTYIHMS